MLQELPFNVNFYDTTLGNVTNLVIIW